MQVAFPLPHSWRSAFTWFKCSSARSAAQLTTMDEQLKEYLAVMQVQEEEYKSGGIKYQSRIIRAFEKSRKRSTYVGLCVHSHFSVY